MGDENRGEIRKKAGREGNIANGKRKGMGAEQKR